MNLGFIEVAVKFAEVMQECDRLCAVEDPTEEPFKSKYAAERALESLASTLTDDRVAEIAGPDEPIVEALLDLRARLAHRRGVIAVETEDPAKAEGLLEDAVTWLGARAGAPRVRPRPHRLVQPSRDRLDQPIGPGEGDAPPGARHAGVRGPRPQGPPRQDPGHRAGVHQHRLLPRAGVRIRQEGRGSREAVRRVPATPVRSRRRRRGHRARGARGVGVARGVGAERGAARRVLRVPRVLGHGEALRRRRREGLRRRQPRVEARWTLRSGGRGFDPHRERRKTSENSTTRPRTSARTCTSRGPSCTCKGSTAATELFATRGACETGAGGAAKRTAASGDDNALIVSFPTLRLGDGGATSATAAAKTVGIVSEGPGEGWVPRDVRHRQGGFQPGGAEVSRRAGPLQTRRLRHRALRRRPRRLASAQAPGVLRGGESEAVQLVTAPQGRLRVVRRG